MRIVTVLTRPRKGSDLTQDDVTTATKKCTAANCRRVRVHASKTVQITEKLSTMIATTTQQHHQQQQR